MDIVIIFSVLVSGIIIGRLLLSKKNNKYLPKIIIMIIWALLFFLGIEVGSNKELVSSLGTLGITALIITVLGLIGSIFFSWILWKLITSKNENKAEK